MRVRFTEEARSRLRTIEAHIAEDSPQNAAAMVKRIVDRAESLNLLHRRGRKIPGYEGDALREVPEAPYRIIYRSTPDEIQILTIMHNRQLLPGDLAGLR